MKKVLALVLVLALILSVQAMAFAGSSPSGGGSGDNVPVNYYDLAPNGSQTNEEEEMADKAIAAVGENYNVESATVYEDAVEYALPEVAADEVIVICDKDGNIVSTLTADVIALLRAAGIKIVLPAPCTVVLAKTK